jgi:hypothetical protein
MKATILPHLVHLHSLLIRYQHFRSRTRRRTTARALHRQVGSPKAKATETSPETSHTTSPTTMPFFVEKETAIFIFCLALHWVRRKIDENIKRRHAVVLPYWRTIRILASSNKRWDLLSPSRTPTANWKRTRKDCKPQSKNGINCPYFDHIFSMIKRPSIAYPMICVKKKFSKFNNWQIKWIR